MIRGIAWDHRRCWGPLDASIAPYRALSGQKAIWERRSLYSFGEGDLGDYARRYDLVIYDHPFVGDVAQKGWMHDLAPFLTPEDKARFASDTVGASWASYAYGDGIWALPIDAAAQTGAWRADLLARHHLAIPETLDDVLELARVLRPLGLSIGWPSVPTDLMCTLVSFAASVGLRPGHDPGPFLRLEDAEPIIDWLRRLAQAVHPQSRSWNPIACLDHMARTDEVAYVPYVFNYVTYAAPSPQQRPITFGRVPSVSAGQPARPLLGGAGIGIGATCPDPAAAFAYAMYLCSPAYQAGPYIAEGGQPGSRGAWTAPAGTTPVNGFFAATLPVLDQAFLRPTHAGFVPFYHQATLRLDPVVHAGAPLRPFIEWLNASYEDIRPAMALDPA